MLRVFIRYRAASGKRSERTIIPQRIEVYRSAANGHQPLFLLHAFCELRRAPRMFDSARIEEAFDAETGEAISNLARWLFTNLTET